jgi:Protein of unknown function (DUF3352)
MRRPMRRLAWIPVLVACSVPLGIVACGGEQSTSGALDGALAYVPKDAPFVAAIETDLDGGQYDALDSILQKFPVGGSLEELLGEELNRSTEGIEFEQDVKPLLGNPFVVAGTSVETFAGGSGDGDFVAAIQVEDEGKLDELLQKTKVEEKGQAAGATIYEDQGTLFAVEGDMVVFAESEQPLEEALQRADGDDHLDDQTFEDGLAGLPDDSIARIYADLQALIATDPDAVDARKVEWVDALRSFGMTASATEDAVTIEFNLRTDPEGLSEEDLPIAAGDEAPPIIRREGEVGFGLRDPSQIVRFAEAAGQAVDPQGFGEYARAKKTLDARLDIDIDQDLIGQLTGDVSATLSASGMFGLRAELEDPARFERTLTKAAPELPSLAQGAGAGRVRLQRDGDLYVLIQPGGDRLVFGVVNDVLVLANDAANARKLADEQPVELPDAKGAIVMSADAERVANELLRFFGVGPGGGFGAQLFTGPLGQVAGSVSATTEGLKGELKLEID